MAQKAVWHGVNRARRARVPEIAAYMLATVMRQWARVAADRVAHMIFMGKPRSGGRLTVLLRMLKV